MPNTLKPISENKSHSHASNMEGFIAYHGILNFDWKHDDDQFESVIVRQSVIDNLFPTNGLRWVGDD